MRPGERPRLQEASKRLAERAAQHRLELVAELLRVESREMSLERLSGLPDFVDREMIGVPILLQDFEANHARIFAAIFCEFPDKVGGLIENGAPTGDIDVRNGVESLDVARGATAHGQPTQ